MVRATNKRTGLPYEFTDEEWESAEQNGIAKKFTVNSKGDAKPVTRFTPPELEEKPVEEPKPKRKNQPKEA